MQRKKNNFITVAQNTETKAVKEGIVEKGTLVCRLPRCAPQFLPSGYLYNVESSIHKYNLLSTFEKKAVADFIEFLLSRKADATQSKVDCYKQKILDVSVWNEEDLKAFDQRW